MSNEGTIFASVEDLTKYVFAGKATITLKSLVTGDHYTYEVTKAVNPRRTTGNHLYFVNFARGGNDDHVYLGVLDPDHRIYKPWYFRRTSGSAEDAREFWVQYQVFEWFVRRVINTQHIPETLEVRHTGTCGVCGMKLTHPDSIDRGIGPECFKRMECK